MKMEINVDPDTAEVFLKDLAVHEVIHLCKGLAEKSGLTPLCRLEGEGIPGVEFDKYGPLEEMAPLGAEVLRRVKEADTNDPIVTLAQYTPQAALMLTLIERRIGNMNDPTEVASFLRHLLAGAMGGDDKLFVEMGIDDRLREMRWDHIMHPNTLSGIIIDGLVGTGLDDRFRFFLNSLYGGKPINVAGVLFFSGAKFENPASYPEPAAVAADVNNFLEDIRGIQDNPEVPVSEIERLSLAIARIIGERGTSKNGRQRVLETTGGNWTYEVLDSGFNDLTLYPTGSFESVVSISWMTGERPHYLCADLPGTANRQITTNVIHPGEALLLSGEPREVVLPRSDVPFNPGDLIIVEPIRNELARQLEALRTQ